MKVGMGSCLSSQIWENGKNAWGNACTYDVTPVTGSISEKWENLETQCKDLCDAEPKCTGFYNHQAPECNLVMIDDSGCSTLNSIAPASASVACPNNKCCRSQADNSATDNCPTANRIVGIYGDNTVNSCWAKTSVNGQPDGLEYCTDAQAAARASGPCGTEGGVQP